MDKIYRVILNGTQYSMLEKMLVSVRASQLARNQVINGYELFCDMMHEICAPVIDGWSTYEELMEELDNDQITLLKFFTKQVFPEDENYFVRQIGKSFDCEKNFSFLIELHF